MFQLFPAVIQKKKVQDLVWSGRFLTFIDGFIKDNLIVMPMTDDDNDNDNDNDRVNIEQSALEDGMETIMTFCCKYQSEIRGDRQTDISVGVLASSLVRGLDIVKVLC